MPKTAKTTSKKITYYEALGRRKAAHCRVRLYLNAKAVKKAQEPLKPGDILVNWIKASSYFSNKMAKQLYLEPFELTKTLDRFVVIAKVNGSGKMSQLEALRLAIARALQKVNPEFRAVLKQANLLTVDARAKERRKVGMGGKARRKRQSPKR